MAEEHRRLRILEALLSGSGTEVGGARICEVATDLTAVTGAGVMVMNAEGASSAVCTTNDVSALVEELQYTLGEGPCIDAYHQDRPVLEPDLADPETVRWMAFTGPAVEAGVRSIFGFPIQVGGVRLGALDLYCDRPGPLSADQHAYALAIADVAGQALLALQADAPDGELAAEIAAGADTRWAVHQAAGMISVQLGVSVAEGMVRLRAHAFAIGRPLSEVAEAVVGREIRFDDQGEGEGR